MKTRRQLLKALPAAGALFAASTYTARGDVPALTKEARDKMTPDEILKSRWNSIEEVREGSPEAKTTTRSPELAKRSTSSSILSSTTPSAKLMRSLAAILPEERILTDDLSLKTYECDALTAYRCPPMIAVLSLGPGAIDKTSSSTSRSVQTSSFVRQSTMARFGWLMIDPSCNSIERKSPPLMM